MQRYSRFFCFFVIMLLLCRSAPVLSAPHYLMLDNPVRVSFSGFASSMAVAGDVDGDGANDLLVGAYDAQVSYEAPQHPAEHQGQAFVFSGKSGKLLFTLDSPARMPYAAFGFAVAGGSDVNKDGIPDLLVGSFGYGGSGEADQLGYGGTGRAFIFSGKNGKLLQTLQAPQLQIGGGFGWSVAFLDDVTGDGVHDVLIGAFGQDGDGKAFIFDGYTGKLVRTLAPPEPLNGGAFGWSVADAGDLNKDGVTDMLVGAPYSTVGKVAVQGRAYAFSGKDGKLLLTLDDPHPSAGAVFGWRLASAGDVNKDGIPDILVGAPYKDVGANPSQGEVFVLNGADGKLLFTLDDPAPRPYAGFGDVLMQGADFDGDGAPEIVVAAPFQTVDLDQVEGEVFVFNGQDGRHLITFDDPYPHQGASFGYSLASPGDLDGDKIPDFAFGASGQSIMDKVAAGRVFVFRSQQ
ncbi:MAG: FG-GAP repeat protein [Deltaproteobacteria bacterium]|nr:FG-GAP repeat protein [Deltaproteobacteria bacterium]